MQLVINIPEEYYKDLLTLELKADEHLSYEMEMIRNGKPLPKGHGRLISADDMKKIDSIQRGNFNSIETIRNWVDIQPTIIEADERATS